MFKQKNKSDFKARAWQKCRSEECLKWKFSPQQLKWFYKHSGAKTGDVSKFFFFRWHLAKATTSLHNTHDN